MAASEVPRGPREAFTLVEVMLAVAIVATTLLYMVIARNRAVEKAATTKAYITAVQLANLKMSELLTDPDWDATDQSGTFEDDAEFFQGLDLTGYSWRATVEEVQGDNDEESDSEVVVYKLTVRVTYPGPQNKDQDYELQTYVLPADTQGATE